MEPMDVNSYSNFALTGGLFRNKDPTPQIQSGLSCKHLRSMKNDEMISSYELLYAFYVACIREGSGRRKVEDCICHRCEKTASKSSKSSSELLNEKLCRIYPIHACLSCVYFGCFKGKCHIREHSKKKKHPFAMDTNCGQVFCFECNDYKYDIDFIKIAEEQSAIAKRKKSAIKSMVKPITGKLDKWEPSPELVDILQCHDIVYSSENDIRGIFNVGNYTCYLNVIVQCLIHAPIFRDYLLSLQHKCKSGIAKGSKKDLCLICRMTNVVQESFSGKTKHFVIAEVLVCFFKRCKQFVPKDFQDAQDCFKDLIVNFHQDEIGEVSVRCHTQSLEDFSPCSCIIHEIFGFELKGEQVCHYCKCVTDVRKFQSFISLKQVNTENVTLKECLKSTWSEEEVRCDACKAIAGCTLQSKPISLPYILNIYSNQFDYKKRCITFLKFEEILDMSPYVLSSWKTKDDSLPEYIYYLFAVIEYDQCHYRCYIKKNKDQWFECDNEMSSSITLEEVLKINVRILFYHRMFM